MNNCTPPNVLSYIQEAYHKYYDSAFWMRDVLLMNERRAILDQTGLTAQKILLEAAESYVPVCLVLSICYIHVFILV